MSWRVPVSGGLTNRNYRVEVDGTPYFVRIPGPGTELLAVDRANELFNTRAAADGRGRSARRPLRPGPRGDRPGMARREDDVERRLPGSRASRRGSPRLFVASMPGHGSATTSTWWPSPPGTWRVIDERAIPVPDGYREHLWAVPRIAAALRARPLAAVPCNNDLLAENYLDDGRRLWIVDYEYSGNNDPTFEIGNTAQELGFDEARLAELVDGYFGEATPAMLARCHLQMIMSDVGWTLWAAIQARISSIDYDFWGWAVERWTRAEAMIDGPDFEDWLAATAAG